MIFALCRQIRETLGWLFQIYEGLISIVGFSDPGRDTHSEYALGDQVSDEAICKCIHPYEVGPILWV